MKKIEATAELFRTFAQYESEKAEVEAVNILRNFFAADAAALFYLNGRREYRFCLAGSEFPFSMPEDRWKDCVGRVKRGFEVTSFGPWAVPGFGESLAEWMGSELYSVEGGAGYLLLGRTWEFWSEDEKQALSSIARTITPIVGARIERERADFVRKQVEASLAASEKRLRSFFEDSRDMIYTANSADLVTNINAAGLSLLGKEKHEIVGHGFSALALNAPDRDFFLRRIREEGYVEDYEIVLVRKDGSAIFCLETAHTLKGPEGGIQELQGSVKDISDRIKEERELWRTNLELAEANMKLQRTQGILVQQEKLASIGQLAAGVAHEINNPMGFLKSNHAMLEKDMRVVKAAWEDLKALAGPAALEIEGRRALPAIFSEFDALFAESAEGFARIMRIVANLKNFSRLDQGGELALYDVNAGIESTVVVAWNEIKYVAEIKKLLGEIPRIKAKGGEINQVLLNILVNAAQAIESQKRSEKGLIEIETSLRGDRVVIAIEDDGPGIPEAIRTRIFDPFFTTKEPGKGTGLGLSISYDIIVAKHGGKLKVESKPGKGTIFTLELPVGGPPEK
jgi:two-component system, NtrC family, sensor kinase